MPTLSSVPEEVVSHDLDDVFHDMLNDNICLHCDHPRCVRKPKFYKVVIESIINQQIKSVLDELDKHVGDIHMERVGVPEMDKLTSGREVERNRFKSTIQKIRSRYE